MKTAPMENNIDRLKKLVTLLTDVCYEANQSVGLRERNEELKMKKNEAIESLEESKNLLFIANKKLKIYESIKDYKLEECADCNKGLVAVNCDEYGNEAFDDCKNCQGNGYILTNLTRTDEE